MGKKPKNSPPAVCGTKDPAAPPGTALLECLDSECQILFARIFQLLAHWTGKGDVIGEILRAVRGFTDLEAAGIRVREGDDYPYFVTDGFSEKFVEAENSLCSRNQNGQIVCDDRGSAVLECMCGEVIRGEVDTSLPFFTPAGSFWTNHRSKLLASDFAKHIKCRIRNRFNAKGYESVAIICLRCDREPVGLLQLYDTRPDCLSRELLSFLEGVGHIIGIVLARISAEEKLSRANDDLEKLVDKRTAELQASKRLLEQEIQERIAIQNELRMSHERLELAMRSGKLGSWDWNLRSNEVFFDQRWSTMFGYPTEDVHPDVSSWQNLIHREDKLRVLNTLKSHVDNLTPAYEAEYRLQGKTGEYRWILDRGKVVERAEDGKALRMAGIYLDITERKRIEEQLVESTAHIRGILESVRDCIFVKNAALEYTLVNPYLVNMLGLPESEIVGRTDRDLFGRQVSESLRDTDRRVLRGEYVEQEHTRTVNGTPTTFLDIKVPMRDSQDKIIGIIGISRDITDRKLTQSSPPTLDPDFDSPSMRSTLRAARLAADTDSIVLLMGKVGAERIIWRGTSTSTQNERPGLSFPSTARQYPLSSPSPNSLVTKQERLPVHEVQRGVCWSWPKVERSFSTKLEKCP
jgi:PAS domain S-box-containing protein